MQITKHKNLLDNFSEMQNGSENVISGEINTAIRDAEIQDFKILKGQKICSFDNMIISVANNIFDSLSRAIKINITIDEESPLITLYRGENFIETDAINLMDKLRRCHPEIEFEMIFGGQSNPELLISIE